MIRNLMVGIALLAVPSLAFAADYELDGAHSTVGFSVKHMMVSNVKGLFGKATGTASWTKPDHSDAKIEVSIDATSVNTNQPKRDAHLNSPDFFDTAKFPTITFKSKKVAKGTGDHLTVTGDLTMHGVTKEVALDVVPTAEVKDPFGGFRVGVEATGKVNRKDFGITGGGPVVGDDVKLEITGELVKKVAAPAKAAAK